MSEGLIPLAVPQEKTEYDITPAAVYVGTAPLGTLTSASAWRIQRITFTAGLPTEKKWSGPAEVWDNHATTAVYT